MLASILSAELQRKLRLSDRLLCKIVLAPKMPLGGNKAQGGFCDYDLKKHLSKYLLLVAWHCST